MGFDTYQIQNLNEVKTGGESDVQGCFIRIISSIKQGHIQHQCLHTSNSKIGLIFMWPKN